MSKKKSSEAKILLLVLAGLFTTALVTCNLIFLKFFQVEIPFLNVTVVQSVGLLPYPFTFLITDVISEIYGKKRANQIVFGGFISSLFLVILVAIADNVPTAPISPISNETFKSVFGLAFAGVFASMVAYLVAQFVDVQIFHFWKNLTKGKHLWLRNNASTFGSQIIDTCLVVFILFLFGKLDLSNVKPFIIFGISYKIFFALFDTPLAYVIVYILRKRFDLRMGEEISDKYLYQE